MLKRARSSPLGILLIAGALLLLGAGCGTIAQPQGWAAPVMTPAGVLASLHKGKLGLTDITKKSTIWEFPPAADKKTRLQGVYGTPVVVDTRVIFGAYNGHVYALNLADGSQVWDHDTKSSIVGSVAIGGDNVFVGNTDGQLLTLNIANGNELHRLQTGERIWSGPVVQGSTVYVTSMDRKVYALNLDGSSLWTDKSADGAIASTPAFSSGRLYFGSFDRYFYALDASNGHKVWQSDKPASNWFWSHPLVTGNTAYAGNLDGSVYAVNTDTGAVAWTSKLGNSIRAEPALVQGVLIVADKAGRVNGFDPATGAPKWGAPLELESGALGDLVVSGDKVLTLTEGGKNGSRLVQIDPQAGTMTVLATP